MADRIDTAGTFRAEIIECGLVLSKTHKPMAVFEFKATAKFIVDNDELKHFELDEPAWIDYTDFNQTIRSYELLYNANIQKAELCINDPNDPEHNATKSTENLCDALGWDGQAFDAFVGDDFNGKIVQLRIKEGEYQGKPQMEVAWINHVDAEPTNQIKSVDNDTLKQLNALIKGASRNRTVAKAV